MDPTGIIVVLTCAILTSSATSVTKIKHVINKKTFFYAENSGLETTENVISKNGYKVEVHSVVTPDGYLLPLFRIPYGKNGTNKKRRAEPILLLPGLAQSAFTYFYLSPERALPFLLANAGFDVFIGNYRGCVGTSHKNLTVNQLSFWKFSIDHIARYDVTSNIDYVLKTTGQKKLNLLGHSLGGISGIYALSRYPKYNKKVRKYISLAAGVRMHADIFRVFKGVNLQHFVEQADFWFSGQLPFHLFKGAAGGEKAIQLCAKLGMLKECVEIFFAIISPTNIDKATAALVTRHSQVPISARVWAQLGTISLLDGPSMFDYGEKKNLKVYKRRVPPLYDISKLTVPCLFFHAMGDRIFTEKDIVRTVAEIGSKSKVLHIVKNNTFAHSHFVQSSHAKDLVYDHVITFLLI